MWNSFALAVQTLTRLPTLSESAPTREDARRAVLLFPLVGALLGVLLAAVWTVGSRVWPAQPLVAGALVLAVGTLLTGGRGLGGIARAGDGLAAQGSGTDRARAFAIMRDPRRGTTGLVALGVSLAVKLAFLSALPAPVAWTSLVLVGALGGWAVAFSLSAFPVAAAAEGGLGLGDAGPNEFLAATVIAIVCASVRPTRGLLALLGVALVVGPTAQGVSRHLGGLNLPLCAALGELAEIVALATLSVR